MKGLPYTCLLFYLISSAAIAQMRPVANGDMSIQFNKNPVKVGIGGNRTSETAAYPATTPASYPHRLAAKIKPISLAAAITFDSSNPSRATVSEVSRTTTDDSVVVILKVTGGSMTPVASPDGDVEIRAKHNGQVVKTTKALVLKPIAIHSPHPEYNGTVTGQNRVLDSTTSPPAGTPPGYVVLMKGEYITYLEIRVDDQYGKALHSIYAGASVTEGGGCLNMYMTSSGTYLDPVSFSCDARQVLAENPPGTPNPEIAQFLASAVPPAPQTTVTQNLSVEVEGHSVNPAIVSRVVTAWVPDNLQIQWP
ncbi:MAG: hypothetical protein PHO14_01375 [Kiritimatiellae bacterium]|nr:hypothetical protein [Kiritimatiellia bacterium]